MPHPSDSQAQRDAEQYILRVLSEEGGVPVHGESVCLKEGIHLVLNGCSRERCLLCEVYAHIGRTRGAQSHKIARDILKLTAAEHKLGGNWRKVLCFANEATAKTVRNESWLAAVAEELQITTRVIPLPPDLEARVIAAQGHQVTASQRADV